MKPGHAVQRVVFEQQRVPGDGRDMHHAEDDPRSCNMERRDTEGNVARDEAEKELADDGCTKSEVESAGCEGCYALI